jgi:hypothetical protein
MHKQKGATFVTWLSGLGLVIFAFVTFVNLAPVYIEHYAIRSMVDDIARDPEMAQASPQQVRRKVNDFLNINGVNSLSGEDFSVEQVEGKTNVRELAVTYEVRKHWIANIDFLTTFHYSAELGKAGDT